MGRLKKKRSVANRVPCTRALRSLGQCFVVSICQLLCNHAFWFETFTSFNSCLLFSLYIYPLISVTFAVFAVYVDSLLFLLPTVFVKPHMVQRLEFLVFYPDGQGSTPGMGKHFLSVKTLHLLFFKKQTTCTVFLSSSRSAS